MTHPEPSPPGDRWLGRYALHLLLLALAGALLLPNCADDPSEAEPGTCPGWDLGADDPADLGRDDQREEDLGTAAEDAGTSSPWGCTPSDLGLPPAPEEPEPCACGDEGCGAGETCGGDEAAACRCGTVCANEVRQELGLASGALSSQCVPSCDTTTPGTCEEAGGRCLELADGRGACLERVRVWADSWQSRVLPPAAQSSNSITDILASHVALEIGGQTLELTQTRGVLGDHPELGRSAFISFSGGDVFQPLYLQLVIPMSHWQIGSWPITEQGLGFEITHFAATLGSYVTNSAGYEVYEVAVADEGEMELVQVIEEIEDCTGVGCPRVIGGPLHLEMIRAPRRVQ